MNKLTATGLFRMTMMGFVLTACGQSKTLLSPPNIKPPETALTTPTPVLSDFKNKTKMRALIYNGPGACTEECASSAYNMAIRSGLTPTYVGASALSEMNSEQDKQNLFKNVALWIQPGGKSKTVLDSMNPILTTALRNFVNEGGGYVGFCAGAFAATSFVGTTLTPGFQIFPGKTILFQTPLEADILTVQWEGKTRHVYWEGGPYLTEIPAGTAEAVSYYSNGQIAAAKSIYGNGKVFIAGFHPEAPQSWRNFYQLQDADGLDYDLVDEMIEWVTH